MVTVHRQKEQPEDKGLVFNIERFCVHDGPGIRTLVFLKGCSLACRWCANPEGISSHAQVVFLTEKCIGCGTCADACPSRATTRTADGGIRLISKHCNHCGVCVDSCPSCARLIYGSLMTVDEVFAEIYKDYPFYRRSGGGVTLSGGEPLVQPGFTRRLLRACSFQNVHSAVETSGYAAWETLEQAFEWADLVLFDLKHVHPLKHLKFTGVDNSVILENLKRLDAGRKSLIIRVAVIPGFNATFEEMEKIADFVAGLKHPHPCHLLPYHAFAHSKYSRFRIPIRFQPVDAPSPEQMEKYRGLWKSHGLEVQIGG